MAHGAVRGWGAVMVAAMALAGCSRSEITSTKASDYAGTAKRVYMAATLGPWLGVGQFSLEANLLEEIRACGVTAESDVLPARPNLTTDDAGDAARRQVSAERIARFGPDTILIVTETLYLMQGVRLTRADFHLAALDPASDRTVWRAYLTFHVGTDIAMRTLARDIVGRLSQDGILTGCPKPQS